MITCSISRIKYLFYRF